MGPIPNLAPTLALWTAVLVSRSTTFQGEDSRVQAFPEYGLTITLPAEFTDLAAGTSGNELRKGHWTAKLGEASLDIALYALPSEKFGFAEPGDVTEIALENIRDLQRGDPLFWYEKTQAKLVLDFLRKGVAYQGAAREPKWTDAEARDRWVRHAPAATHKKFEKQLRTAHYISLTCSSVGKQFAEAMEKNYAKIKKTYPFEDAPGHRLMPCSSSERRRSTTSTTPRSRRSR